ncbi:hypothetical protein C7H19_00670 [Aphanothece hegewaldii CCALA 016]|uniref:DUF218 domain-containing protein n=1 Tax=Aphanothece hegewaldii CCALA 016 TaxID=2107694 RepID=A0A2T1M3B4_9CHRO|nr:hypothetical protein C7H19_00670 [Aphanothece hegewaldii CCALA 016]
MKKQKLDLSRHLFWKKITRLFRFLLVGVLGFILLSLINNLAIRLPQNLTQDVDAILVLGGSVQREIYATELADAYPKLPILISQGSSEPCIVDLFRFTGSRKSNVWLEKCANSTFENFFFSVPILKDWGVHKVKVVTSPTHLPRAEWLVKIHLGAQGIAAEMSIVKETGIPGNNESLIKTGLDITRSMVWGIFSQIIRPYCSDVTELSKVDLNNWKNQNYQCESRLRLYKNLQRKKQGLGF